MAPGDGALGAAVAPGPCRRSPGGPAYVCQVAPLEMGLAAVIFKSRTLQNFILRTSFRTALEANLCTHHMRSASKSSHHRAADPSPMSLLIPLSFWKPVLCSPCVFVIISLVLAQGFWGFFFLKIPHMNEILWCLSFPVLFHAEIRERSIHIVKNGRISFFFRLMIISTVMKLEKD